MRLNGASFDAEIRAGRLSRRELLQRAGAAGAVLGLGGLLAACGGGDDEPAGAPAGGATAETGAATTAAATPTTGGTAQMAMSVLALYSTLDPARSGSIFDLTATGMLYESLLKTDDQFVVGPGLAEEWEISPDGMTWTLRLREGVEFHDGSPLTAADAVYSLQRILDAETGSPSQGVMSISIDPSGITAPDDRTVQLALKAPNGFLGQMLASYNFRIIKDGTTAEDLDTNPIGTGPFKYVSSTPAESFEAEKNPNYWQSGLPYLDGVRIVSVPDQAAKLQAILSGDAHIGDEIQPTQIAEVEGDENAQLLVGENLGLQVIALHQNEGPFTDVKVRQAIKHSIDREAMVNVIVSGAGDVGQDVPVNPGNPLLPEGFQSLTYDPERAKSLLAEAGYPDGFDMELWSTENVFLAPTATTYKDQAKASGINVKINQVPTAQWGGTWNAVPAYVSWWVRNPPDIILHQAAVGGAVWNESQFDDPEFNDAIAKSRAATDLESQRAAYAEALPILAERSGWSIPFWFDRTFPAKKALQGVVVDPVQQLDFTRASLEE